MFVNVIECVIESNAPKTQNFDPAQFDLGRPWVHLNRVNANVVGIQYKNQRV